MVAAAACAPSPGGTLKVGGRSYAFSYAVLGTDEIALSGDADAQVRGLLRFKGSGTGTYPHDASDPDCSPCTKLFELRRGDALIATSSAAGHEAELRATMKVTESDAGGFACELSGFVLVSDPGAADDGQVVSLSANLRASHDTR
jgi:hypothetical protein